MLDGGHSRLFDLFSSAAVIVFGGTFGAVAVSFPGLHVVQSPSKHWELLLRKSKRDPGTTIDELVEMASIATKRRRTCL